MNDANIDRRVVYTAILGGYEDFSDNLVLGSGFDAICFTDNENLVSQNWRIELVVPSFPDDPVRSARHLKIMGHPIIDGYSQSLWVDNRIQLLCDANLLFDEYLKDSLVSLPMHSYRETVADEFQAVLSERLDNPATVRAQLCAYGINGRDVLGQIPYWTAILLRKKCALVDSAMSAWMYEVLRFSRRDQLSVNYAFDRVGIDPAVFRIDNYGSDLHQWASPAGINRQFSMSQWNHGLYTYSTLDRFVDWLRRYRAGRKILSVVSGHKLARVRMPKLSVFWKRYHGPMEAEPPHSKASK